MLVFAWRLHFQNLCSAVFSQANQWRKRLVSFTVNGGISTYNAINSVNNETASRMTHLPTLLCGSSPEEGLAKAALGQLQTSLNNFSEKSLNYFSAATPGDVAMFGPFCARVVLENGCAALVGRLDPFRLLYLSEFQAQEEYTLEKRVKSSFAWTGDVIADDKGDMWNIDHDVSKISRALFSKHVEHVYWKPALNNLLDFISAMPDPELADILSIDPDTFIPSTKGRCTQLYSQLSKGVHWEFFSTALQMDEVTVKELVRDTFVHLANLGLISHFIPTAYASLTHADAVHSYIEFRKVMP